MNIPGLYVCIFTYLAVAYVLLSVLVLLVMPLYSLRKQSVMSVKVPSFFSPKCLASKTETSLAMLPENHYQLFKFQKETLTWLLAWFDHTNLQFMLLHKIVQDDKLR